jgi:hypothetical protein
MDTGTGLLGLPAPWIARPGLACGHHTAAAMLAGGGACGGTITLCVLIINTLRSR